MYCTIHFKAQAHDTGDQHCEYLKMFQSFDSLSLTDLQAITEQPLCKPIPLNKDQPRSVSQRPAEENPEDDASKEPFSQPDVSLEEAILESYAPLPSPASVKASVFFPGKKVGKFTWTSSHFKILADLLEFIWKIIEKWKRWVCKHTPDYCVMCKH